MSRKESRKESKEMNEIEPKAAVSHSKTSY